jgi:hypothetical protein
VIVLNEADRMAAALCAFAGTGIMVAPFGDVAQMRAPRRFPLQVMMCFRGDDVFPRRQDPCLGDAT